MTWYGTSSTTNATSTYSYTYSYAPYAWTTTTVNVPVSDCAGVVKAVDVGLERRRKEAELQKAFDEVFDERE